MISLPQVWQDQLKEAGFSELTDIQNKSLNQFHKEITFLVLARQVQVKH